MIEIDDALTSVRKHDWHRLVRAADGGETVVLADPGLPRPVLMSGLRGPEEHVATTTYRGPVRSAWAEHRAASWLRGRAWSALVGALMAEDGDLSDEARWAIRILLPHDIPVQDPDGLTAAAGRRLLRALAVPTDNPPDGYATVVRSPADPADTVMLAIDHVTEILVPMLFSDGPDAPVVRAGLMLRSAHSIAMDVGHEAWVADQSGQPWTSGHAAEQVLAAAARVGLPFGATDATAAGG